ncbi:hypothetical protein BSL78_03938, partial [Apostichopus japonicus]
QEAKGVICLPGYNIQKSDKKKWAIKISHKSLDKDVYLEAEKESDWRKWMEHLQRQLFYSRTKKKLEIPWCFQII